MLNDLAKAMKALDGKKWGYLVDLGHQDSLSDELNAQVSLPTDDEYHAFQDQDQLQEH